MSLVEKRATLAHCQWQSEVGSPWHLPPSAPVLYFQGVKLPSRSKEDSVSVSEQRLIMQEVTDVHSSDVVTPSLLEMGARQGEGPGET